jgi:hypothetical protein
MKHHAPLDQRIHVRERYRCRAGQQWMLMGELGQEPAARSLRLAHLGQVWCTG